ncbi:MBL fold metallo-hydrolase [Catalinimonas alkaloidigena]|uniref:MBL fold metallo-hydrolase n=1 Tax=Catalinimonas alkaloidigena TaxID=1075417 RepID=UPI002405E454|nr:MBL fold metallo-hydrolase [Catalinimonas alkaloidigena]
MLSWIVLGIILLLIIIGVLFLNLNPVFGGKADTTLQERFVKSGHYKDGKFVNLITTTMDMKVGDYAGLIADYFKGTPNSQPDGVLPVRPLDSVDLVANADKPSRITWFGHSAILLELEGKNIFIDPMLGDSPSPLPWLGSKRYSDLPIAIEKLPALDAVIISHDHYDHLDYGSILKLKDKVGNFYVPLGVGAHLRSWGVSDDKIHELNWWDQIQMNELTLVCAPARHFSGRGVLDRDQTLWSSWIISSPSTNIYFSGDSGYGPHFAEIGERYGPFDFAMMECGQYDSRWEAIHMMPEQTVQAGIDLKAELIMPIHWGAFTLALHSWTDPVERATAKAQQSGVAVATPIIGEAMILEKNTYSNSRWWESVGNE